MPPGFDLSQKYLFSKWQWLYSYLIFVTNMKITNGCVCQFQRNLSPESLRSGYCWRLKGFNVASDAKMFENCFIPPLDPQFPSLDLMLTTIRAESQNSVMKCSWLEMSLEWEFDSVIKFEVKTVQMSEFTQFDKSLLELWWKLGHSQMDLFRQNFA